jgi:hypothetical protein
MTHGESLPPLVATTIDFGYWILDFGLGRPSHNHPQIESNIKNQKSKI